MGSVEIPLRDTDEVSSLVWMFSLVKKRMLFSYSKQIPFFLLFKGHRVVL